NRRAPDGVPIGDGQLLDVPVGRGRVDEIARRVGDRRGIRYACRPRPAAITAGREGPEYRTIAGVDRQRLAIGRRQKEGVVRGAVDLYVMQVDERGIHRTWQVHLLPLQRSEIARRDTSRRVRRARVRLIEAEAGPVMARRG